MALEMAADSDMPFGPDALKAIRGHYFNGYAETGASPDAIAERGPRMIVRELSGIGILGHKCRNSLPKERMK